MPPCKMKSLKAIAVTGILCASLGAVVITGSPSVFAQDAMTNASEAPAAWRDYAQHVQERFRDWLGSSEDIVQSLRGSTPERAGQAEHAPSVVARVWITADGKVAHVKIAGLGNEASETLRAALEGKDIGQAPPEGMAQPLHLKLSAGEKE